MRVLILALLLACCGFTSCERRETRPDVVTKPVTIERTIVRYVPIDDDLTLPFKVAEGPLSECPMVAAERKAALVSCNARLIEIGGVEGSDVTGYEN